MPHFQQVGLVRAIIFKLFFISFLAVVNSGCGFFWGSFESTSPNYGKIAVGNFHSCALSPAGKLRCWGYGGDGELGYGNANDVGNGVGITILQAGDVSVGGTPTQVCTGGAHTCVLFADGNMRCFGWAFFGQLGYNNQTAIGDNELPSSVGYVPVGGAVRQIACGVHSTCALLTTGAVRCWGEGADGKLGYGDTNNVGDGVGLSIIAAGDVSLGGTATQISAGRAYNCALLSSGDVKCWGRNNEGQLGIVGGAIGDNELPSSVGVVSVGGQATYVMASKQYQTCAILAGGNLKCWGTSVDGELGYNMVGAINPPSASFVNLGGISVVGVAGGGQYTCAVLSNHKYYCWGRNTFGQLGYNNTTNVSDGVGPSLLQAGYVRVFE